MAHISRVLLFTSLIFSVIVTVLGNEFLLVPRVAWICNGKHCNHKLLSRSSVNLLAESCCVSYNKYNGNLPLINL